MQKPKCRKPAHPGEVLLEEFLLPLQISQAQFASYLGWTNAKLNEFIQGKRNITLPTAVDLSAALGTSPLLWVNLQLHFDLWKNSQQKSQKVICNQKPSSLEKV